MTNKYSEVYLYFLMVRLLHALQPSRCEGGGFKASKTQMLLPCSTRICNERGGNG